MKTKFPDLSYEKILWKKGYMVIGVDEVGRGALAGPLVVGAVVFSPTMNSEQTHYLLSVGINDSKKLTAQKREELAEVIEKYSLFHATATIDVRTINRVGIGKTTEMAVRKVISKIKNQPRLDRDHRLKAHIQYQKYSTYFLLLDAFYVKYVRGIGLLNQKAIVHGDEKSLSIAAASIIAKVYRDHLMKKLSKKYPFYSLHKNKGYGTEDHRLAISNHGKSIIHRKAFIHSVELSTY